MNHLRWLWDWDAARTRPVQTRAFLFATFGVAAVLAVAARGASLPWFSYAMIGISAGIGGVTLGEQAMRSTPEERQHRARLAQKRLIRHGLTGVAIVVVAVAIALLTR
ncbi:MAG TPA: hypothetical protein VF877_04625 [Gaiellaceae bacterium]